MLDQLALAAIALGAGAYAQQVGDSTAETHPSMPWQQCTASGCTDVDGTVVLDANWRWVHNVGGYTNCYEGSSWNDEYCPDGQTCAEGCALEGADYSGTYGISASGGSLSLSLVTGSNVGSRVYLMDSSDEGYEMFKLKNREFTFDVDVSGLPCGLNGALYFVSMDKDGGQSRFSTNKAGAAYGTGYCDSQCPQDVKFINGEANVEGWESSTGNENSGTGSYGACCNEMDIWEANSISTALTPHVCKSAGQTRCEGDTECGVGDARYDGDCDKDGCDFNPYRQGNTSYYGSGKIVDTDSKMTVVTQFITADGSDTGTLSAIRRIYVQGGQVIQQSESNIDGIDATNEITQDYCEAQKSVFGDTDSFSDRGGMEAMGDAFDEGMVLVMSIWDDYAAQMLWLDAPYPADADPDTPGVSRGTCASDSGNPEEVESQSPDSKVVFSNIKFGVLGSTYDA